MNPGFMIKEFSALTETEYEFMLKVPLLVSILIAGADGNIDRKEIREAISIASSKKDSLGIMGDYFREVASDFEDKLKVTIQSYPYEVSQREGLIIEELSDVNELWSKIPKDFSTPFYDMLLELACKIASSSGGWLGINAVTAQEARFLKLPMVKDPSKI